MKDKKYKIVMLSDLKDATAMTLKSTISLAKMIAADIELFHVTKPTEIVERDNQLSAYRDINDKHVATEKKMKKLVDDASKFYGVQIHYKFSFGNVKDEIDKHIKQSHPDIIVLGKRKPKLMRFIGNSVTQFVLKNYQGTVMIAANKNPLEPNLELSLGVFNSVAQKLNIDFADQLMSHSHKPLKSFKIIQDSREIQDSKAPILNNRVEYTFEQGTGAINNLSKYLSISKVNLLFIDRMDHTTGSNAKLIASDIQNIIDSLNVSLLLGNGKLA